MLRAAAVAVVMILLPFGPIFAGPDGRPAAVSAQTAPAAQPSQASAPATAEDVAKLRRSLEELRAQLAALNRRLNALEEQLNAIPK